MDEVALVCTGDGVIALCRSSGLCSCAVNELTGDRGVYGVWGDPDDDEDAEEQAEEGGSDG